MVFFFFVFLIVIKIIFQLIQLDFYLESDSGHVEVHKQDFVLPAEISFTRHRYESHVRLGLIQGDADAS